MSSENSGYIALHRKILDNPVVCRDNDYFRVWLHLLLSATHKGYFVIFAGQKTELKAGQLLTGRKILAEKCNISESKVQRILKSFEIERQIEQQTCNKNRLITIVNWSLYQNCEQQTEQPVNIKRTTTEQQVNTNNNVDNDKNVKNKKENIKRKSEPKTQYAEYVSMTNAEYQALIDSYGVADTNSMIEILDNYKGSCGKNYKSDYRAIKNWVVGELDKRKKNCNTGGNNNGTYQQDDYAAIGW